MRFKNVRHNSNTHGFAQCNYPGNLLRQAARHGLIDSYKNTRSGTRPVDIKRGFVCGDFSGIFPSLHPYDVIIVGGGFTGTYNLYKLTKCGFRCKLIEKGSDFGGTWYWNRYPGARVDTYVPGYEFSLEEVWKDWEWKDAYPSGEDLLTYVSYSL